MSNSEILKEVYKARATAEAAEAKAWLYKARATAEAAEAAAAEAWEALGTLEDEARRRGMLEEEN